MLRLQKLMVGNALLVILAAMLAGFMLGFGLIGGLELLPGQIVEMPYYGTAEGWARAHTGGVTNGLLVLAVALCLPKLNLSARMQKWSAYGFIYVAWSFTVFYWLGNASSNRALTMGKSALGEPDLIGLIGFLPGLPSVLIVVVLLFVAAKGVFARPS